MGGNEMIPLSKQEIRILDISCRKKLSHLSSCLTSVALIDSIYKVKKESEPFILSNGHAGLALYVILEKEYSINAEGLYDKHGTHPNRDLKDRIYCSTGSLGSGIAIAVGMALANKKRNVYVLMGDGEFAEGSCWESLRIAGEQRLENLKIMVNANGYSALGKVDTDLLDNRVNLFYPCLVIRTNMFKYPDFLNGVNGHYATISKEQYEDICR